MLPVSQTRNNKPICLTQFHSGVTATYLPGPYFSPTAQAAHLVAAGLARACPPAASPGRPAARTPPPPRTLPSIQCTQAL